MKFLSDIEVEEGLRDDSGDLGTAGQILSSTGTATNWIDQSTIVAGNATVVEIECKNTSGSTMTKGTPVYQTGTVGATSVIEVAPADALISANKLPAIGLLQADLINNAFGFVVVTGELLNITTSPIDGLTPTIGDKIFVKSGGGLTLTKPTGEGNGIQNMGLVGKVSGGNAGSITVSSIMRTNDVPNLPEGKIWIGDGNTIVSDTVYVDEPNLRLGIGTTSPAYKLHVIGTSRLEGKVTLGGNVNNFIQGTGSSLDFKSNGEYNFTKGANTLLRILSTGNVGIGTTSPTEKLHVDGNARVTGAYYDSNNSAGSNGQVLSSTNSGTTTAWVNASSGTIGGSIADNQIAVGASTANNIEGSDDFRLVPLTLGSVTAGRLVVQGRLVMSDDLAQGAANLFIGNGAGSTTWSGINIGIGGNSLRVSAGGELNCALGYSALRNSTLGDENTALGHNSLYYLTGSGQDYNTAIGTGAAQYYSTGTDFLTQSSQGVYIGNDTRASANNISNEIVIGYSAVGGGSDTITLGNSSIDLLRIPGLGNTNGHVLTYNTTAGGFILAAGGGGGGGIGGSITAGQVAFGDTTADEITGSSSLTFTSSNTLKIDNGGSTGSTPNLVLNKGSFGTSKILMQDAGTTKLDIKCDSANDSFIAASGSLTLSAAGVAPNIKMASASSSKVGIGVTLPQSKLQVDGGIQMADDTAVANLSAKAGTMRYREVVVAGTGNSNSYVQMYMRTGTSTYDWTTIIRNNW